MAYKLYQVRAILYNMYVTGFSVTLSSNFVSGMRMTGLMQAAWVYKTVLKIGLDFVKLSN